jgi:hypothetical protein
VPARAITSREHSDNRRRRQDLDDDAPRPRHAGIVTLRRPAQERIATQCEDCAVQRDEDAIRQAVDAAPVPALGAALQPFAVEHLIHLGGFGMGASAPAVRAPGATVESIKAAFRVSRPIEVQITNYKAERVSSSASPMRTHCLRLE